MKVTLDKKQSKQLGDFISQVAPSDVNSVWSKVCDKDTAEAIKKAFQADQ